jgi:hypothetical protein
MNPSSEAVLRDRELLAARDAHFARLEKLYAGQRLEQVFALAGVTSSGRCDPYTEPEQWVDEALDDLAAKADVLRDGVVFRPLVLSIDDQGPFGSFFVERLLGADVYEQNGEKNNWQIRQQERPVGTLRPPDLDNSPAWQLAQRMAAAFRKAEVSLPLFGLPSLSSALTAGLNLCGPGLLTAMTADPESAHNDLRVINDLICALHRWYRQHIPVSLLQPAGACTRAQPVGCSQLCGCATERISAELYRAFVASFDDELLSVHRRGGMIHLGGSHTQHIPTWRDMNSLRAVHLEGRAAEDMEAYFEGLRDDQIVYIVPSEKMPLQQILEISGGLRIVLVADIKEPLMLPKRRRRRFRR